MKLFMFITMILAVLGVQGTYQSDCLLRSDRGDYCQTYTYRSYRFFYNTMHKVCLPFLYGGCGGNKNRFGSYKECKENCKCVFPAKKGPCRGKIPRFYYDYKNSTCKEFIYGGCNGNTNNFESFQECMNNCGI